MIEMRGWSWIEICEYKDSNICYNKNMENISQQLEILLSLPAENEIVEWKEAKNDFDFGKLGKYFSALSNEANLGNKKSAWLIFGVKDDKSIVGSNYRKDSIGLNKIKSEIAIMP